MGEGYDVNIDVQGSESKTGSLHVGPKRMSHLEILYVFVTKPSISSGFCCFFQKEFQISRLALAESCSKDSNVLDL